MGTQLDWQTWEWYLDKVPGKEKNKNSCYTLKYEINNSATGVSKYIDALKYINRTINSYWRLSIKTLIKQTSFFSSNKFMVWSPVFE